MQRAGTTIQSTFKNILTHFSVVIVAKQKPILWPALLTRDLDRCVVYKEMCKKFYNFVSVAIVGCDLIAG